jgi:hypothetical protein
MGYFVRNRDKHIWGPALEVGDFFLGNVQLLEKYLKMESGISSPLADEIEIDKQKLDLFLSAITKIDHPSMLAMTTGTAEILKALKWKIDNIDLSPEAQRAKAEKSTEKYLFVHEGTFRD